MAAMAASIAAVAAASTTTAASASVSLLPARALAPAAAFPLLRLGARPRSLSLRIRASAEDVKTEGKATEASPSVGGQTFSDVRGIIAEQLAVKPDTIQPQSKFADLGADSLDTVEIMMALEEKFNIQLDADKGETIKTVQDAVGLIEETVATGK